jgi:hypothetical protein
MIAKRKKGVFKYPIGGLHYKNIDAIRTYYSRQKITAVKKFKSQA